MSENNGKLKLVVEAGGAMAVLLGLVFVGLELRQNTSAVEAATFQGITDATNGALLTVMADAELSRIWAEGFTDPKSLSKDDYRRFYIYTRAFWVRMQNTYSQWQRGTLSEDDWQLYRTVICSETGTSALRSTFDDHRVVLSTGFQDFIAHCWAESPAEKN